MQAPAVPEGSEKSTPSISSPVNPSARAADRRSAMELPLVKQVMEVFPDAVLFDVRNESNGSAKADPKP
jgi:hypothetical protein